MIRETYNEGIIAMIHITWCKTHKQTIMLEETFPKEIDHECDTHKSFWHLLIGHETWPQTNSIIATNPTCKKLEM